MRHLFVRSFDPTQTGPTFLLVALRASCATARASRQVAAHHQGVQLLPVRLPVVAFAAPDNGKSGPLVEPPRRLIVFLDLEEYTAHAAAGEVAEMGQEQVAGETAAAVARGECDREYFGLVRRHPRHREPPDLAADSQTVHQRVALG